jgi:hypothetical protein
MRAVRGDKGVWMLGLDPSSNKGDKSDLLIVSKRIDLTLKKPISLNTPKNNKENGKKVDLGDW